MPGAVRGIVSIIVLLNLLGSSGIAWAEQRDEGKGVEHQLLIPCANPLQGSDAGLLAWHTATELLTFGVDKLAGASCLDGSRKGRFGHLVFTWYVNHATRYYSHEVAHQYHNKRKNQHFWVDMSDWSYLAPKFVFNQWQDYWDSETLRRHIDSNGKSPHIISWWILTVQAGLYQEKFNAVYTVRRCDREGVTTYGDGMRYWVNQVGDFIYNARSGSDTVTKISIGKYYYLDANDITMYLLYMRDLGIIISRDDWLAASGVALFASGQTWNAVRALYRYLADGTESVPNLSFRLSDRISISPPNFYLFATYRGLYLQSETFIGGIRRTGDGLHVVLGTGLDSFDLEQTGPVDWLRMGAQYDSFAFDLRFIRLEVSPFCYLDFNRSFRHRGQSLGAELRAPISGRFSMRARIEHNRADMIERVIKNKDEGLYVLAALGIAL